MSGTSDAPRAIVFAYHDVGVRCLRVVLDAGVHVPLVVTHTDDPREHIWFGSVAGVAAEHGLDCVTPADPNDPTFLSAARDRPGPVDFVFSFYYRHLLAAPWLNLPRLGAFNMHGSLLPRYRGRAPVNWAVIHGERETGATLHAMQVTPDSGAIVDQCAVPILGDDTARDVFAKVVVAAEIVLARSLPRLIDGTASLSPQDRSRRSYFGGRRPDDGRMPHDAGARQIHDLVRALAPPYPCAFVVIQGRRLLIERTRVTPARADAPAGRLCVCSDGTALWLHARDGGMVQVLSARFEGDDTPLTVANFDRRYPGRRVDADV